MRVLLILSIGLLLACEAGPIEQDQQEIVQLLKDQQRAHLENNAAMLVAQFSNSFLSVNKGAIYKPSKEEALNQFQRYFDAVSFRKWEDVTPPLIRFSEDGSMAYAVVDKLVVLEQTDNQGARVEEETHFAWVAIFRKLNNKWQLECIASTNMPENTKPL